MNVSRLFDPERLAVVGASKTEGKLGHEAMANAVAFDGPVYPVNPSASGAVLGEPFVESIAATPEPVDLALVCVPAPVVPDVVAECGEAGVGGVVVYAGGFAEAGEEGSTRQAEIVATAERHDIAVLGPNTSGFVRPAEGLYCSFAGGVDELASGDVAIVAQSGGVAHAMAFQAHHEGRGISAMVGLGNRATVDFETAVAYFDADDDTGAIVLHVEGTDRGRAMLEACRAARTPVVAYKVGRADVDEFAASHTGALTGDHALYEAGFAQYGIPTVDSTTALLDAGTALGASPRPAGPNVGVVTAQAGPGIVIADRIQRGGGRLPALSAETRDRLEDVLPGITYADNPVDTGRPMPAFGDVVVAVAEDDAVDVVLVYELYEAALGFPVATLAGLADRVDKPVLFATEGAGGAMEEELDGLREAGVPVVRSPERAAEMAAALARYATLQENRQNPEGDVDG